MRLLTGNACEFAKKVHDKAKKIKEQMAETEKYGSREERDRRKAAEKRKPTAGARMTRGQYARLNAEWLSQKTTQEDVLPLPKGLCYKVIGEGCGGGDCPTERSIVTVHYTGRLIDGRVFDGSRGGTPLAMRLCDLIPGWVVTLTRMHVGDRWEVYIPADMAYGKRALPGIPGGSTLVFDIELLGVS